MTSLLLRIIALISITCNGLAVALVDGTKYYTLYILLRSIGQMAIPLSTFLVVEGFHRTSNKKFYFLRLFAFGIAGMMPYLYMSNIGLNKVNTIGLTYTGDTGSMTLSDILTALKPTLGDYSYFYYSDLLKTTGSSVIDGMVTLSFSLLMLIILDKLRMKYFGRRNVIFALLTSLVIIATILICAIFYMDSCVYIPLFVCLFYFQRGNKQSIAIMTVMISILFYTSGSLAYASAIIISILLIFAYNGKEGIEKYEEVQQAESVKNKTSSGKNAGNIKKLKKSVKDVTGKNSNNAGRGGVRVKNSFLITKYAMYAYYPLSMLVIYFCAK